MTKFLTTTALIAGAFAATAATATTYQHTAEANRNGVENATFTYSDTTERFGMSFTSEDADNADGFWVVVNNGPQPYHQAQGHLAILYSDLTDVWAYQYTGMRGVAGVNTAYEGTQLARWTDVVKAESDGNGKTTYSMTMGMAGLNSLNVPTDNGVTWEGVKFDSLIGTWLHTTQNTFDNCGGSYVDAGNLTCFNGTDWLGWDEANRRTTTTTDDALAPVPVPAGLPLLLAGLGAFGLARRYKKA